MRYTAKKLAQLSGVSVRTLHWYDKIGLLKPASYGEENGYRYYDRKQLLALQHILFFRELGFKLKDIAEALSSDNFDQISALRAHQEQLETKIERFRQLIKTIKRTITDLEGGKKMEDKQLYQGFYDWAENQTATAYGLVNTNDVQYKQSDAEQIVMKNLKKVDTTSWSKADWDKHAKQGQDIYAAVTRCLEKNLKPKDAEVQKIVATHYTYTKSFHDLKPGVYEALAELYRTHKAFKSQLDAHSKKLPEFMSEAMLQYAKSMK